MGLVEIGAVFMVCGLMMLVVQLVGVTPLARRWGEARLASAALAVMGLSLALQMATNEEGLGMNVTEKATSKKGTSP
jgi:hypothetical protein